MELEIERLANEQDRYWSKNSLGGMYDYVDYRVDASQGKQLAPGVTDAFGNAVDDEEDEEKKHIYLCGDCRKWEQHGTRLDDSKGRQRGYCKEYEQTTTRCDYCTNSNGFARRKAQRTRLKAI